MIADGDIYLGPATAREPAADLFAAADDRDAFLDHHRPRRPALIAGPRKLLIEVEAAGAGPGLYLATVSGKKRDRILRWCWQRILRGDFHVLRVAARTLIVDIAIPGPLPVAEYQRYATPLYVEIAHASIAGSKAVRPNEIVVLVFRPGREGLRLMVAPV